MQGFLSFNKNNHQVIGTYYNTGMCVQGYECVCVCVCVCVFKCIYMFTSWKIVILGHSRTAGNLFFHIIFFKDLLIL